LSHRNLRGAAPSRQQRAGCAAARSALASGVALIFTPSLRPRLRALATSFIPETALARDEQWAALETTLEHAVAGRPGLRGRLVLLIGLLDAAARIRYGKGLIRLDAGRRAALLERLASSRWLLLRRGIWGMRTLVLLGWYTQPEVAAAMGYRASPAGWGARR